MGKTTQNSAFYSYHWEYCAKVGKGRKAELKPVIFGDVKNCSSYFDGISRVNRAVSTLANSAKGLVLKFYLIQNDDDGKTEQALYLQRLAIHCARIIARAKRYKGNSTMDKICLDLSRIFAEISGPEACQSVEFASEMLNSWINSISTSQETKDFIQEATLSAIINQALPIDKLYGAIYSDLHKFLDGEGKYTDNCKAIEFDSQEVATAVAFEIGLPEDAVDSVDKEILLYNAVNQLADRQKNYVTLHSSGYADIEIAKMFETTSDAVQTGRRKAQKNILDYIAQDPDGTELLKHIDYKKVYEQAAKRGSVSAKKTLFDLEVDSGKNNVIRHIKIGR